MESLNKPFGKSLLDEFQFQPGFISINNGSFGSCPRKVEKKRQEYQARMNQNPQKWHRVESELQLHEVRKETAKRIKAPDSNIFIVANSSNGVNCFLRSIEWKKGDIVLATNTTYQSVNKVLQHLTSNAQVSVQQVDYTKKDCQSPESILKAFKKAVEQVTGVIKMAVIDHISSKPSLIFPVEEMVEYLHSKDIPVFVDGAHAIGQVDIDISKIQPEGYVSNFHKWAFGPVSAAFLYVSPKYMKRVHPCTIGNYYGQKLDREFFWEGTRDITSFCAITEGLSFLTEMKSRGMDAYMQGLCKEATQYLCKLFNTTPLTEHPALFKFMSNIQVPIAVGEDLKGIMHQLLNKYNLFCLLFEFDEKVYWRISVQVYNDLEDFKFAGEKLMNLIQPQ